MGAYLVYELASDGAYAADEKVQLLILGEEETVVDNVQGLAQVDPFDDDGDVGLGCSLGEGNHAYAASSESGEQPSGGAGVVLHLFSDHSYGGKVVLEPYGVNRARSYFGPELLREQLFCLGRVFTADTYAYACL